MRIITSSYETNNSLNLIDITNNNYKIIDSISIPKPSFIINDDKYIYTYEMGDRIILHSYVINEDRIRDVDDYLVRETIIPQTTVTHIVYSKINHKLYGCSYADGTFFSISVENGCFKNDYKVYKQKEDIPSKCHCVFLNHKEDLLGIVNIALDEIFFYDVNLNYLYSIKVPNGSGPRHAIYGKDDEFLYIITEYSNEIIVIDMKTKSMIEKVSTLNGYKDSSYGATLFLTNNNYLFASNRGKDNIVKYKITNGLLTYVDEFPCYGFHPRHMIKTDDDKFLLSCNKNSNNLSIISIAHNEYQLVYSIDLLNISCVTIIN